MSIRAPVIVLVLAFTAVPIEVRPVPAAVADILRLRLNIPDIVLNVLGYVPVGVVLAGCRAWTMALAAIAISGAAEASQIFTVGRAPSALDLATNFFGSAIGWFAAERLNIRSLSIPVGRKVGAAAALLALAHIAVGARYLPREFEEVAAGLIAARSALRTPVSARGTTEPGTLEGAWVFDEDTSLARDVSGHGLDGRFVGDPRLASGASGHALMLNGSSQHVDLGDPMGLRLTGSMSISAWMNPKAASAPEAVIVSRRGRFGYQMDVTTFRGAIRIPRTLAFRLTSASGRQMVRYGRTTLDADTWHHVAGVYDASARTLNVYLDGRLDNGCLIGDVTSTQIMSESRVLIGRNNRRQGSWFRGLLDDVKIYSRPLTPADVVRDMGSSPRAAAAVDRISAAAPEWDERACAARPPDARVAGLFVAFGLLVAIAFVGLWPMPSFRIPAVIMSVAAGVLILPSVPGTLPDHYRNVIPLLTLAGGLAAVMSMKARNR